MDAVSKPSALGEQMVVEGNMGGFGFLGFVRRQSLTAPGCECRRGEANTVAAELALRLLHIASHAQKSCARGNLQLIVDK